MRWKSASAASVRLAAKERWLVLNKVDLLALEEGWRGNAKRWRLWNGPARVPHRVKRRGHGRLIGTSRDWRIWRLLPPRLRLTERPAPRGRSAPVTWLESLETLTLMALWRAALLA
jgi:hypothetical protein